MSGVRISCCLLALMELRELRFCHTLSGLQA